MLKKISTTGKFKFFLAVARALNSHGIIPAIYGSLGVYRILPHLADVNDIDIVVPDVYLGLRFSVLAQAMAQAGFRRDAKYPREFTNGRITIGCEPAGELRAYAGVLYRTFRNTELDGVRFKELSAGDYLAIYRRSAQDWNDRARRMRIKIRALEKVVCN